ncbi:MAG: SDR family oxidoreductase [Alphaproteobacteria bacterium]
MARKAPARKPARGRTAFVTGGTGFLGINLIDELLRQGWRVTALHRPTSDLEHLSRRKVTLAPGDIAVASTLGPAIPEQPDAVFHVAASLNQWSHHNELQHIVNVEGTRNVVEAALAAGAKRFIHTSSISVYGLQPGRIDESAEQLGRVSWINYQRTKYLAEEEVRAGIERGLDAVFLNPCNIIGAYDTTGWARIIRLIDEGKLPGAPPGAASFCDVGEVARAHIIAVDKGRTGENYLLGGTDASYLEMIGAIGRLLEKKTPTRPTPAWLLYLLARIAGLAAGLTGKEPRITREMAGLVTRNLFADSARAEAELGYASVPLDTMLARSIEWLKGEGLIEAG